jgi:hypothetical protein
MFSYQIFDFVQLMRGKAIVSRKRYRGDPELGLITPADDVDVGGLVSFVAIKLKSIAASRNLDRWHRMKMAVAF